MLWTLILKKMAQNTFKMTTMGFDSWDIPLKGLWKKYCKKRKKSQNIKCAAMRLAAETFQDLDCSTKCIWGGLNSQKTNNRKHTQDRKHPFYTGRSGPSLHFIETVRWHRPHQSWYCWTLLRKPEPSALWCSWRLYLLQIHSFKSSKVLPTHHCWCSSAEAKLTPLTVTRLSAWLQRFTGHNVSDQILCRIILQ